MASQNGDCRYCRIVAGELDAYSLYENEYAYAFLNPEPVSDGHSLVVPKRHTERFTGLGRREAAELFRAVHRVADAVEEEMDPEGLNLLQSNGKAAGQDVSHVHVHVIPRQEGDGFDFTFGQHDLTEEEARELRRELDAALE